MTHSEFMKAAHRQAKRFHVGCTYAQSLSQAMVMLYAAARKSSLVAPGSWLAGSDVARDAMGVPVGEGRWY